MSYVSYWPKAKYEAPIQRITSRLNPLQDRRYEYRIHLCDGAVLAAKVFERSSEMVKFLVVEDQKPVMKNVANVVMLPVPMLSIVNLSRRPYWKLKLATLAQ